MKTCFHRLAFFLCASAFPAVAQEADPSPAPEPAPPVAIPVDEQPMPVAPDPAPQPVVPGGNVPQPQREERSLSRSGMFRVFGGGPEMRAQRGAVALLLEQTKDDFEELMVERADPSEQKPKNPNAFATPGTKLDDFRTPVDVVLVGKPGDAPLPKSVAYELDDTGHSFNLRIRIHLARGIDNELLQRMALTVLLYERALRDSKPGEFVEGKESLVVRPWLVEGLMEAQKWRSNTADRRLYEGVFKQGGGFTMDELFEISERNLAQLDSTSVLSFRALSGALVMALLEQPHGKGAFRSFCGEAARFSGEMPVLLRKHFPELNLSEKSLAKWWALTLAKLVQPKLTESLSIRETETMLNESLIFHTRDADGNAVNRGMDAWQAILELEEGERLEALKPANEGLVRLSYRCFPSYRPLLNEYQQILRDISQGKDKDIGKRVAELNEQRKVRLDRALRARDFMDFTEISQARELSGQFDDYMRLKKDLELRPRATRHDRVTDTLDRMEKTYDSRRER
ncbi:hypothetical protein [Luteolibacter luteus]|uniref:Uncharacterized protein n=1 Tax=Luteolibacter luteus TaxID=2728835 RepID=A0A858RNV6_9BACT|nr:hypothetical protein [Luteolibacter luteus]QJE98291.1 hypothetical protein HHL09_21745 [Luteolibacter luteus]